MKLSYQWLSEYVDLENVSPDELAERLTSAGLEVDEVVARNQGVSGVVVGEVVSCEQHPNADRLRVCQVDVGGEDLRTIVCGAPNVNAGQRVVTALPGAVLPGGAIGVAKLRGIESQGMLCSAKEIGLEIKLLPKEQTEGLYILPADAPIGEDVVSYLHLDDVVLDIGLTPNRSDCLSIRGFAYEVAALYNKPVKFMDKEASRTVGHSAVTVRLDTELCKRYEAQVLSGLQIGPSPLWMQMRLLAMGVRPINLTVDITNYVMLEWGQPLHAFDLDEVHQGTIVVRQASEGERVVTLDGEERSLTNGTIVIADPDRAIGIAGVMGGENSEITAKTNRIVLESAVFDAVSVRRTGQLLGLRSEAQQRFERGIDPVAVRGALVKATQLLVDLAGGKLEGGIAATGEAEAAVAERVVRFSPDRCNRLLGTSIRSERMRDAFERLRFTVDSNGGAEWSVSVPTRRADISLEADLVEEVARMVGYDTIPSTLPIGPTTVGVRNPSQKLRKRTRDVLMGAGMTEVSTYSLVSPADLDALRVAADAPYRQMITLLRPMSEERTALRTHMLPSLAQVAAYNLAHGVAGGQIFELNRVYWPTSLPLREQPCERMQWAGLWFGEREATVETRARAFDFYDAKGVVETWLHALGWARAEYSPVNLSWLHPGRSAQVLLDGERIGTLGELHPETAEALELGSALYAEFDLDLLVQKMSDRWRVAKLPRYPASRRDLAVLVRAEVPVADLIAVAKQVSDQSRTPFLEECRVFDVYTGKGIADGMKSLAFSLVYRSEERTLTDEEITALEAEIVQAWSVQFGATLRTS